MSKLSLYWPVGMAKTPTGLPDDVWKDWRPACRAQADAATRLGCKRIVVWNPAGWWTKDKSLDMLQVPPLFGWNEGISMLKENGRQLYLYIGPPRFDPTGDRVKIMRDLANSPAMQMYHEVGAYLIIDSAGTLWRDGGWEPLQAMMVLSALDWLHDGIAGVEPIATTAEPWGQRIDHRPSLTTSRVYGPSHWTSPTAPIYTARSQIAMIMACPAFWAIDGSHAPHDSRAFVQGSVWADDQGFEVLWPAFAFDHWGVDATNWREKLRHVWEGAVM